MYIVGENQYVSEKDKKTYFQVTQSFGRTSLIFRGNYVERDAIVAAFCDATFVVECGIKSGTMHTVNAAIEYNRQIYCYSPKEKSFDGNEFILENNKDAVKVDDIEKFCKEVTR